MKKSDNIYIAGHNGLVGSSVYALLKKNGYKNLITVNRNKLDLRNYNKVEKYFKSLKIDYMIMAAAKAGGIMANSHNQKDVNDLYYSFKQFCYLIIFNNTEGEFNKSVPKYLFREKGYLLGIFNRYNKRKKDLLIKLLMKTERALRLESELCMSVGLRFVLSFKKLTIS